MRDSTGMKLLYHRYEADLQKIGPVPDEVTLRTCLNEAWFSDTLAWLLDPTGNHRLGKQFLEQFLMLLAKKRRKESNYTQGAPHLHYGRRSKKTKKRPTTSDLSLKNATVHREFFLSKGLRKSSKASVFCDVVVLDLDPSDGLFLAVENKLFTQNHKGQLEAYFKRIEDRYDRAPVREYVYLTLRGEHPVTPKKTNDEAWAHPSWVRMSWLDDVLGLLEGFVKDRPCHSRVHELMTLLCWMKAVANITSNQSPKGELSQYLVSTTGTYLLAELNWLCGHDDPDAPGRQWNMKKLPVPRSSTDTEDPPIARFALQFSSTQAQTLWLDLLPSFAVGLQARSRQQKATFEKLIVPFGAHPDQVFNLLDVTARDIYHRVLTKPSDAVLQGRWKRGKNRRKSKEHLVDECRKVFDFLHNRRFEMRVLFGLAGLNADCPPRVIE